VRELLAKFKTVRELIGLTAPMLEGI